MIGFRVCTLFLLFQMQGVTMKNTLMLQRVKEEIPEQFGSITIKKINGTRWKICLVWQMLWLWVLDLLTRVMDITPQVAVVQMFIPV